MKTKLAEIFREYWNNFLSVEGFASYYGIPVSRAQRMINLGRWAHDKGAKAPWTIQGRKAGSK